MVSTKSLSSLSDQDFFTIASDRLGATSQGERRRFKYRMTNRNLVILNQFVGNINNKTILAVSGSSIPILEWLSDESRAPKAVFGFDYSPKQVAYNYFLKFAITELSFNQFKRFFFKQGNIDLVTRKKVRNIIISKVPNNLRKYVTNSHEFTKRDINKLLPEVQCSFLSERKAYDTVRQNIYRVKYFIANINLLQGKSLSQLFDNDSFDFIYLSNVLDWICWHNKTSQQELIAILRMLKSVSTSNASMVIDHLTNRVTILPKALELIGPSPFLIYNIYYYLWSMYRIKMNRII